MHLVIDVQFYYVSIPNTTHLLLYKWLVSEIRNNYIIELDIWYSLYDYSSCHTFANL